MDFRPIDEMIRRVGPEQVVERAAEYITETRQARMEEVLSARLNSVHVAVERPYDPRNAAAVVRTAEAFGLMNMHVIDVPLGVLHGRATTQGSFNWLHTHNHRDDAAFLSHVRSTGARIAGALMTGTVTVDELPVDRPLCVLFGNEKVGLSEALLAACDVTFRIPMQGMSESLNLSVSAAITLHVVTHARRQLLGKKGDLVGSELLWERARYYAKALEPRLLEGLFPR